MKSEVKTQSTQPVEFSMFDFTGRPLALLTTCADHCLHHCCNELAPSRYRINMTVRVIFYPCAHMSLLLCGRRTMVILGLRAGGLTDEGASPRCRGMASRYFLSLPRQPGSAGRDCALQPLMVSDLCQSAPSIRRTQEYLCAILLSSFPYAVHYGDNFALRVESGVDLVMRPL